VVDVAWGLLGRVVWDVRARARAREDGRRVDTDGVCSVCVRARVRVGVFYDDARSMF
jgi:hypothetical protein